jgi:hypothetical protein
VAHKDSNLPFDVLCVNSYAAQQGTWGLQR